jgi:ubiquinol-cytochrome c reductase cytochrome c subunit
MSAGRGLVRRLALGALLAILPIAAGAQAPDHPLYPGRRSVTPDLLRPNGVAALHPPAPASLPPPAELVATGRALYDVHCISCHGANLEGTGDGPSLQAAGGASVDFFISTGRMPLAVPGIQGWHAHDMFDARQTAALVAYVTSRAHVRQAIPDVTLRPALVQRGRLLFEENCEACHGAAAEGADAGFGWIAPPLDLASPTQIGEAIRIGPGIMPVFTPAQLSDDDVDAIATYVRELTTAPANPGGTPFGYLGPLAEGAIAGIIGIGGLFLVIYFTGTTSRGARLNEPH